MKWWRIVADARRESEILRGEGEAERNAIFANAFTRDSEFFEFYRFDGCLQPGAGGRWHDHGPVARSEFSASSAIRAVG